MVDRTPIVFGHVEAFYTVIECCSNVCKFLFDVAKLGVGIAVTGKERERRHGWHCREVYFLLTKTGEFGFELVHDGGWGSKLE